MKYKNTGLFISHSAFCLLMPAAVSAAAAPEKVLPALSAPVLRDTAMAPEEAEAVPAEQALAEVVLREGSGRQIFP